MACPEGQYGNDGVGQSASSSSSSDMPCTKCAKGRHSGEGVGAGQSDSSVCKVCPAGQYAEIEASVVCEACAAGQYAVDATVDCKNCEMGTYQEVAQAAAYSCKTCGAGQYAVDATVVCKNCETGRYQEASEATAYSCKTCGAGKFAVSATVLCKNCEMGKYQELSVAAAYECKTCGAGKYAVDATVVCKKCENGYQELSVATAYSCKTCGAGKYAVSATVVCKNCEAGRYQEALGTSTELSARETVGRVCKQCPRGWYSEDVGASTEDACKACAAGLYSNFTGAPSSDYCFECPSGRFGRKVSTSKGCEGPCPRGHYCLVGTINPVPCPFNTYSNALEGGSSAQCVACPRISSSPPGSVMSNVSAGATQVAQCVCQKGYFFNFTTVVHQGNGGATPQHQQQQQPVGCTPCTTMQDCNATGRILDDIPAAKGYWILKGSFHNSDRSTRRQQRRDLVDQVDVPGGNTNTSSDDKFYACLNPLACLGSSCAPGYTGKLCAECESRFVLSTFDQVQSIFFPFILFFFFFVLTSFSLSLSFLSSFLFSFLSLLRSF